VTAIEVSFNQQDLSLLPGQSLLDAALSQNINIANSCRSGICQTCLVKINHGTVPLAAQQGLSENQIRQNLALACQLRPTASISASDVSASDLHRAIVVGHDKLNDNVLRLRLKADIDWFPGQYLTLWRDETTGRPYSIASLSSENFLEFHIKHRACGCLSSWLHNDVQPGDHISIGSPRGNCFYSASMQKKPLLLIGAGTGLAPLYGVCRQALAEYHPARIDLLLANSRANQCYLHDELRQLVQTAPHFYFQSILRDESKAGFIHGDVVDVLKQQYPSLQHWCVFICGAPKLVQQLQKLCFLRGASLANIFTDAFITAPKSHAA
jgi:NAD(P)H-flavin reductase